MLKFWVLLTRDSIDNSKITKVFSPDLMEELILNTVDINDTRYDQNIILWLKQEIARKSKNVSYTLSPKELSSFPIDIDKQFWKLYDFDIERGLFAKILPIVGYAANFSAIIAGGFVNYMALSIVSSTSSSERSARTLSISGSILSSFVVFLIYLESDAASMLSKAGSYIDVRMSRTSTSNSNMGDAAASSNETNMHKALYLLAAGSIFANIIVSGISSYQEVSLQMSKYLDLDHSLSPEQRREKEELLRWLVINTAVFASACTKLAFQLSFANKMADHAIRRFNKNVSTLDVDQDVQKFQQKGMLFQFYSKPNSNTTTYSLLEQGELNHASARLLSG